MCLGRVRVFREKVLLSVVGGVEGSENCQGLSDFPDACFGCLCLRRRWLTDTAQWVFPGCYWPYGVALGGDGIYGPQWNNLLTSTSKSPPPKLNKGPP